MVRIEGWLLEPLTCKIQVAEIAPLRNWNSRFLVAIRIIMILVPQRRYQYYFVAGPSGEVQVYQLEVRLGLNLQLLPSFPLPDLDKLQNQPL